MAHISPLINDNVNDYYVSHAHRETDLLRQFREATLKTPGGDMLSSPEQCQFLSFLIQSIKAKNILEVGTFTGYATLWMAQALPKDGRVTTCEIDEKPLALAKHYWQKAGATKKITVKLGLASETLEKLVIQQSLFDFVYLDADKANYPIYYELSLKLLKPGGMLAIDNVLWFSQYVHEEKTKAAEVVSELNKMIQQDERVSFSMLPIGGGLTLVIKK